MKEKYKQILDLTTAGFCMFDSDTGTIVEVNNGLSQMIGCPPDKIIGRSFSDFFHENGMEGAYSHADNLKTDTSGPVEMNLQCNDGTSLTVLADTGILTDAQQQKSFHFVFFIDISRQKAREERLRLFSEAVDQSGSSIIITDKNRDIQYVNQRVCSTTGYKAEELIGKNTRILKSGEHSEATYKTLRQTITQGGTWRGRLHNRHKDGTLFWENVTISPVFEASGAITHFMAVKDDVTAQVVLAQELKDAREEALAANLSKSEFLANMSHEIRTPMNVIIGMTNLALETSLNDSQRQLITSVRKSADALLRLINDILDYSKIEAGKLVLETRTFDLEKLIAEIGAFFSPAAREKGLKLITRIQGQETPFLQGDSLRLRQILLNLAGNAIKFTQKGRVEINAKLQPEDNERFQVLFSVRDTGIGIKKGQQSVLFNSFSQGDASVTRKFGGTGLGLAICRQLVHLMGGRIWLESVPGKGTTFFFNVVLAKGRKELSETAPIHDALDAVPLHIKFPPLNILFVEDNKGNQDLALVILRKEGHRVTMADNGLEALYALSQHTFDLIFMDVQMPQMDGLTATRYIRKYEEGHISGMPQLGSIETILVETLKDQHVPIIAVTASAMPGDQECCLAAGADIYLTKPYNKEELLRIVANHGGMQDSGQDSTAPVREVAAGSPERLLIQIKQHLRNSFGVNAEESESILKTYGSILAAALVELKSAIETRNLSGISRQVHTIKGALLNLGQSELAETAKCMERAAKEKKEYNYAMAAGELENKMKPLIDSNRARGSHCA